MKPVACRGDTNVALLIGRWIRVLTVDPRKYEITRFVAHHNFGLFALLAEFMSGLDCKQLRLPLCPIRTKFLAAECDEPSVLSLNDQISDARRCGTYSRCPDMVSYVKWWHGPPMALSSPVAQSPMHRFRYESFNPFLKCQTNVDPLLLRGTIMRHPRSRCLHTSVNNRPIGPTRGDGHA
jgi:hypothetical protein